MRNSRYVMRKGPLIIYGDENNLIKRTARNLPGVDTCSVHRLNLLTLAPGGHIGRFIIWTKDAFQALNTIFGNYRRKGVEKGGYVLNRNLMTCADLSRIINSDQVQSKLRQVKRSEIAHDKNKKNPLKNRALMKRLNPFNEKRQAAEKTMQEERHKKKAAVIKDKRKSKAGKKSKKERNDRWKAVQASLADSYKKADDVLAKEEALNILGSGSEDEEEAD